MSPRSCGFLVLLLTAASQATTLRVTEPAAARPAKREAQAAAAACPEPPANNLSRPAYQLLRQNENWSVLAERKRSDFYDPIKYVPLNRSRSVWVSFGGHIWARTETWDNFGFSDEPSREDTFGVARIVFHTDVHMGRHVRFFVEVKSALATDRDLPGGRRPLDVDEADLQEVFVDFSIPVVDAGSLTFRLGRQHLMFGKQRLVSPFPWANTMRTFDGFSAELKLDDWKLKGFWTRPVPVRKFALNRNDPGTQFYGAYASGKSPISKGGLEVFWLGLDKRRSVFNGTAGRERRHTVGGRIWVQSYARSIMTWRQPISSARSEPVTSAPIAWPHR